jgi:hypothetical protein
MRVSVIVPVRNDRAGLGTCLAALRAEAPFEVIVADDASTDDSAAVAAAAGVRVLRTGTPGGAGAARNRGAREARGDVLLFVDADVAVAPGCLRQVERTFRERPDLDALFGSYDARPAAPGLVSQYRNLLHHWVHQQGNPDAFTFWAGCGAIRRPVFQAMGGFVERGEAAALEDVELGYRLRAAGHRVLLDRTLLCTHLKRWTLRSMLRTDVMRRAVPWGHLLLTRGAPDASLSLQRGQRPSVVLAVLALALLPVALVAPAMLAAVGVALAGIALLNRPFYAFLRRERGMAFALAAFPLHVLYFVSGGVGLAWAWLKLRLSAPPDERVYVE